jgi:RNA polymerase sigma-70 factor (ECF subfamily)
MDELNAIRQLKQGDLNGLEWLVDQFHARAYQVAVMITNDAQMAEDVVQETFISLPQTIRRFDDHRPFGPWFFKCIANAAVQAAQKNTNHVSWDHRLDEGELDAFVASEGQTVEDEVELAEMSARLAELLHRLSPLDRAVLVQRYYLQMSEEEMAREQQVARGTVKWRLSEARKKLRSLLKSERKRS